MGAASDPGRTRQLDEETGAPVYQHPPAKVGSWSSRRAAMALVVENTVFGVAALLALGFAAVLVRAGLGSWTNAVYVIGLWAVLAYLALPRIHRILTAIYVPDYFIGRARTSDGLLGDPVNLALTGDERQIHAAMTAAGWIRADPVDLRSSVGIVLSSLTRRSYPRAPVSPLLLFGRVQDFAYQQEVAGNPARRHHVRFWKCPDGWLLPGGSRVGWLAAGTYDRAVGLSLFTFQVTHKIDQDIDVERDYIIATLRYAVPQVRVDVIEDFSTGYHSRNGGGDRVRTDGNLPVVDVRDVAPEPTSVPGPPAQDVLHRLGRRPVSVIAAVLLTAVSLVISVMELVAAVPDLTQALQGVEAREASAVLAFTIGVSVLTYLVLAVLAWRTYAGSRWARWAMLVLFLGTVILDVGSGLRGARPRPETLLNMGVDLLALYALTSRSAWDWTRRRGARQG